MDQRPTATPFPPPAPVERAERFRPSWPTILVVADQPLARRQHVDALRSQGYTVHVADGHETAMVILRDFDPSLTLIELPARERDLLLQAARSLDPDARIVLAGDVAGDELLRCVHEARRRDEDRPPAA